MEVYRQALKSTFDTIKWYATIDPQLARSIAENMQDQARFQRDNQIGFAPQVDAMYDASAKALNLVVPPSASMRLAHHHRMRG
jgi:(2Fe-2S) ferredoxin